MAVYPFWLVFTGLCGFVPHADGTATAVLIDATNARPAHEPVLIVPSTYVGKVTGTRLPRRLEIVDKNGQRLTLFWLEEQQLRLSSVGGPKLDSQWRYVASLHRATGGKAKVGDYSVASANVVARVELTEGALRWDRLAEDQKARLLEWDYEPVGGGAPKYAHPDLQMPEEIVVKLSSKDPALKVTASTWELELSHPGPGQPLRIDIKNLPLKAILELTNPGQHTHDEHFELFYGVLEAGVTKTVPHVIGPRDQADKLVLDRPVCIPALYPTKD